MDYEERQDAMSDFIAENTPNCDDCGVGIPELLKNINEAKLRIDGVLSTYSPDDVVMNEVKKDFGKLWKMMFNLDPSYVNKCPCKKECEF